MAEEAGGDMQGSDDNNGIENVETLRLEHDRLRGELDACRHDLHQARVELAQAREIQEVLEEQLCTGGVMNNGGIARNVSQVSGAQLHDAWARRMWRRVTMSASRRALQQNVQRLRGSELFDRDWYLAEYPDVANSGMDPAEHYLLFGVHEGRDPGPLFSTDAYRRDHPEVLESGINPLVHFLRSEPGAGA